MLDNPAHKTPTAYKLVTLLPNEKVLGVHIIGEGSDEIMQFVGVAIKMGATKKDLDDTVAIRGSLSLTFFSFYEANSLPFEMKDPTSAEELVTMR